MNLKHIIAILLSAAMSMAAAMPSHAQTTGEIPVQEDTLQAPEGFEFADSVVTRFAAPLDSTLYGKNIFAVMPLRSSGGSADVHVHQSQSIRMAMLSHIKGNPARETDGYRVRIFFDNKQTSRTESETAMKKFMTLHPDIPAYRNHINPYFKVTVGDFRTKSEAMQLLKSIVHEFPTAFIVKEKINYPVVDKSKPTVTDTVRILRPVDISSDQQR